jgi:hypothetical protein
MVQHEAAHHVAVCTASASREEYRPGAGRATSGDSSLPLRRLGGARLHNGRRLSPFVMGLTRHRSNIMCAIVKYGVSDTRVETDFHQVLQQQRTEALARPALLRLRQRPESVHTRARQPCPDGLAWGTSCAPTTARTAAGGGRLPVGQRSGWQHGARQCTATPIRHGRPPLRGGHRYGARLHGSLPRGRGTP